MSQTETNPNFNPTTTINLPKQQQQQMPPKVTDFSMYKSGPDRFLNLNCNQMDWIKIASKNKYINTAIWSIDSSTPWYGKEIDVPFVESLMQVGREVQTFYSFSKVLISIQPTHQAFFQGNTKFAFDPAPNPNYYSILGYSIDDYGYYQFQTVDFSPKSTQSYNFLFPMNIPFAFLQFSSTNPTFNGPTEAYLKSYNMGRLRSRVYSELTTKGTNTSISYHVSAQIIDLKTEGMFYP